jgi:hypothetical protein
MITDDLLQLITASVDGELTPAESRRLRRLLDSSPEARALYTQFHADSKKLHALPRAVPPADLHGRVMAKIAALTPVPTRLTKIQPQQKPQPKVEPARPAAPVIIPFARRKRTLAPLAIAAGLLIGISATSFLFFNQQNQNPRSGYAKGPVATHHGASDPAWAKYLPADSGPRPSAPSGRMPDFSSSPLARNDFPPARLPEPEAVAVAPTPRPVRNDILGARPLPATHFDQVEIRLPFLKSIAEFDREDLREEFATELGRDPAFRIDLFTRNPARGVELFEKACKSAGVSLAIDATTMSLLQKRSVHAAVVYTESLTASDLATLMSKLAVEDAKVSPHVFDLLHATPISDLDAKDLRVILGVDPGLYKRLATDHRPGEKSERPDPTKPLSANTADQIVKSVTGQGKSGVMLAWNINGRQFPQGTSPELKQFLSKRGERKPNVVPVIIVIRPGNG